MILQYASPKAAYWLSSPSTYYLTKLIHESVDLIDYKKSASYRDNFIENYRLESEHKVDTTQIIFLIAINSFLITKERDRSIASGKDEKEAGFKASLDLLRMSIEALILSDKSQMEFFDYGPLHWLHPSGPTEILLLTMVDSDVINKSNHSIIMNGREMLYRLEKDVEHLPASVQEDYRKQLQELRLRFTQT